MSEYGVILFHTTSAAIRAEKLGKSAGFDCKLIPVPREYSSDCGISLRFIWYDYDAIKSLLEENNVEISGIYELPS